MGKHKKGKKAKDQRWVDRSNELEMTNERMEKYYKAQNIVPESEWDTFMHALRQPLPSTFRLAGNRETKHDLNNAIRNDFLPQLESGTFNGEPLPIPRSIPWYPEELAWHLDVPRKELRKSPEYKRFHSFLVYETEIGNISRQEAVSMLPPLFLDVRPHHRVIDLCAAPGSKTSQLLEAMDPPTGILVANDSDFKRSQLLVHTCSRLPSPGLMVTNLDASIFPTLQLSDAEKLYFDRVLADVPCSGDGTLRKNIGIWRSWSPMEGNGLHSLQLRILQRAMRMLRRASHTGEDVPRIVYSTCSLNPVENEAVVAAALNSVPGFELVDVSDILPTLKRRSGLTYWRPAVNRDVDVSFASYDEYCSSLQTTSLGDDEKAADNESGAKSTRNVPRNRMRATHWPPENVGELKLDRCMRIYPHLQDTGGFFVAVLQSSKSPSQGNGGTIRKRRSSTDKHKDIDEGDHVREEPNTKRTRTESPSYEIDNSVVMTVQEEEGTHPEAEKSFKENPYTFVPPDEPGLLSCLKKLHISNFPCNNVYVRNPKGSVVRSLYLVNDNVKAVIKQSDHTKIRLVSAGVKLFGKSALQSNSGKEEEHTTFRVLNEGLPALIPYLDHETLIKGDVKVLRIFLDTYYPLCTSFPDDFREQLDKIESGSQVIKFLPADFGNSRLSHVLYLPMWKSDVSVSLMVDKKGKSALSLRFFGEDITVAGRQTQSHRCDKTEGITTPDAIGGDACGTTS